MADSEGAAAPTMDSYRNATIISSIAFRANCEFGSDNEDALCWVIVGCSGQTDIEWLVFPDKDGDDGTEVSPQRAAASRRVTYDALLLYFETKILKRSRRDGEKS